MSATTRGRVLAAAATVPIVLGAVACSDNDGEKAKQAATSACPADVSSTAATTPMPADVPLPGGATAYSYDEQGKTRIWFVALELASAKLPALRDAFDTQLRGKGYSIDGTDQEADVEAESEFTGPHEGTANFRHLCAGKAVLRLKLTS